MPNKEKCEGVRGTNICGRNPELLITNIINDECFYSCLDCPGRIIVEQDIDEASIERLYD